MDEHFDSANQLRQRSWHDSDVHTPVAAELWTKSALNLRVPEGGVPRRQNNENRRRKNTFFEECEATQTAQKWILTHDIIRSWLQSDGMPGRGRAQTPAHRRLLPQREAKGGHLFDLHVRSAPVVCTTTANQQTQQEEQTKSITTTAAQKGGGGNICTALHIQIKHVRVRR